MGLIKFVVFVVELLTLSNFYLYIYSIIAIFTQDTKDHPKQNLMCFQHSRSKENKIVKFISEVMTFVLLDQT